MSEQPNIETDRLLLRPFRMSDAPEVRRLAGDRDVASTTLLIPYPYEEGVAEEWIATHQEQFENGESAVFAIVLKSEGQLAGAISLSIEPAHDRAEMGYWIGKPYWSQGYCTEAALAVAQFAFGPLGLNRVIAHHMTRNPASGRVLQKIGMTHEGSLRKHLKKWDVYEDVELYGILEDGREPRK